MSFARSIVPLAVAALLAGCSGNLGGGQSTLPGMPQQGGTTGTQGYAAPTPTATPESASNVATIGDATTPQALPAVMGFGGSIAFPKPTSAPSATPNPRATPANAVAPAGTAISIGVTAAVVEPSDAPHFGATAKAKRVAANSPVGVLFISLLSTADVTLGEYPRIAVDVPREIAAKYRDREFALALFDPETKGKSFRLNVAERDLSSPAPGSVPVATPVPTVAPTAMPSGMPPGMAPFTPPPVGTGLDASALPAEHIAFLGTAATLTLRANRTVVFALYAAPVSPTPSPSPRSSAAPSGASPAPSASPSAASSPAPVPSSSPSAAPSAGPSPK